MTRDPVVASRGVVSAGDPLAASAALQQLMSGGNAVDAALAASAVQCVVEMPWSTLGGDLFLLVYTPSSGVQALNGSGRSPVRIGELVADGATAPRFGPASIAVPGLPAAWQLAAARYASRPASQLLAAAIDYASAGFPIYPRLEHAITSLLAAPGASAPSPELARLLTDNGRRTGQAFRQPELAATLRAFAAEGAAPLYGGA
ncbi:MAG: gamma-glutamyltransferase, partial [Chloroflexi bacterium]|nr:gamma-glutamyltransferase [Chloroflexota bacterium]